MSNYGGYGPPGQYYGPPQSQFDYPQQPYHHDPYYNQPPPPHYAQPNYPPYNQPPPPRGYYPAPAAPPEDEFFVPPEVAQDPNQFRRFFSFHLQKLTFNSKPIITNLTLFAHQHLIKMSSVIASCLEEHLRNCPPNQRLPALYLLDSISKNIGPPYIVLFTRFIERIFLNSYHAVDEPTKIKLEELLGTWRTGGSDGGELFRMPEEGRVGRVQRGIESALFGNSGRGGGLAGGRGSHQSEGYNNGVQQVPAAATPGERSGVLFDVRRLLGLRKEQAALNPADEVNLSQVAALQKLENLVLDTQLTSDQVYQIRGQLAALTPAPLASAVSTPIPGPSTPLQPPAIPPPSVVPKVEPGGGALQGIDLNLLAQLTNNGGLDSLLGTATKQEEQVKTEEVEEKDDRKLKEYDEDVMRSEIQLTSTDLARPHPDAASFLYERLSLQCTQCGLRYLDSKSAKKQMDAHLDWHFTHKRRIREGAARPQGRSWFSSEEDWLHSDDVDVMYDSADQAHSQPSKEAAAKVDRAILLARKVIAPTDPQQLEKAACPICKEKFKSEWSDDDEDWVWFNAEVVDGVTYHATCHSEAMASKMASRLRIDESAAPSRESTPMMTAQSADDGGSSRKRKAEEQVSGDDLKKPKAEDDV